MILTMGVRAYRGAADDALVRELLSKHIASGRHPFYSVDAPNWERFRAAFRLGISSQVVGLWPTAGGTLDGLALYLPGRCTFSYLAHPDKPEMDELLIDWAEDTHLTAECGQVDKHFLRCSACHDNSRQQEALRKRGYSRENLATVFRRRELSHYIPPPGLLPGYDIHERGSLAEEYLQERATAESEVFGSEISADYLRLLQDAPIYRPQLDLLVTAPDGRIAAFCMLWFDEVHSMGYVEPIGTVPIYRRKGLGKALMLEGFRRLERLGATAVYLGHRADNNAANRLYEAVGMPVFDREYWLGRAV